MCSFQWAGSLADECRHIHHEEVEKREQFYGYLSKYASPFYWWFGARLQWLLCIRSGVTAVLCYAFDIDLYCYHINRLVQERRNSSALAVELHLSCTNLSISNLLDQHSCDVTNSKISGFSVNLISLPYFGFVLPDIFNLETIIFLLDSVQTLPELPVSLPERHFLQSLFPGFEDTPPKYAVSCVVILIVIIPRFNEASVRLSVCGQNRVRSVSSTTLIGSISYLYILSSNFRRCVTYNVCFKKLKFWRFL